MKDVWVLVVIVGVLLALGNSIMLIIDAFREGIAWGLLCLFFWPVQLVFIAVHWSDEWRRLLWMGIGIVVAVVGASQLPTTEAAG